MRFWLCAALVAALSLPAFCPPARADQQQAAEKLLTGHGLRKLNQTFVLPDEAATTKKFRELSPLAKKVADAQQKAAAAESKVEYKKKLLLDYAEKRRLLRVQIENAKSVELRNRLVNLSNELVDRSTILEKSDREEKEATAARAAAAAVSEQYVELLLELRRQYDQVAEKYDRLAENAKLHKAIEDLNADSKRPYKLGPTGSFALLDRNLKKLESKVLLEAIALRRGGGNLWHVTATFNGKHAQDIAIDTGASIISLPHKVAAAAGMKPAPDDPIIRVGLADGSIVEAKQVFASSVRVGKFIVENVECAVMPPDLPNAEPLLGLSFLNHFSFKIDNADGKLVLCKIEPLEKSGRRP